MSVPDSVRQRVPQEEVQLETAAAARPGAGLDWGLLDGFVGFHLRLAYERAFDDFAGLLGPESMRPGYFTMLTLIVANPGITQVELGRAAGRDKSSVAKALRQMEDAGLIRRVRLEDDRRTHASYVTEAGRAQQARMQEKARLHLDRLLAIIGEERRDLFLQTLKDLVAGLPAGGPSPSRSASRAAPDP